MSNMPRVSNFPSELDSDQNLFLVRDALRVRLMEDYNPGDAIVQVEGDPEVMSRFPPTGIITLTEQCDDIDTRAISFYYNLKTDGSFEELEILPGFADVVKPKRITNVTMNVVDRHHNHLKDALVQVQSVLGSRYDEGLDTVTGRLKRVEKVMFRPKAWFTADKKIGLVPLKVTFANKSLRTGNGTVTQIWDFGDGETSSSTTQGSEEYGDGLTVEKTYSQPGLYTVSLTITNEFGEDTVEFADMISVRMECPEEAIIQISPREPQIYSSGSSSSSGGLPRIRSLTNTFIDLEVPEGVRPSGGYSYAGELLSGSSSSSAAVDPIVDWTWSLGDDLPHASLRYTKASYSLGGYYDIVLRVDTQFGSFRITSYENSIDIVESTNLWLFNLGPSANSIISSSSSVVCDGSVVAYEFGLNSETFKIMGNSSLCITRDDGFLDSSNYNGVRERARREFRRNVEFVRSGSNNSGEGGDSFLFWAGGGNSSDENKIHVASYNAFADNYSSLNSITDRPWNWVSLAGDDTVYFLFGSDTATETYPYRTDYSLPGESPSALITLSNSDFENGAGNELLSSDGYFSVYRSAWKDSTGYILKNVALNQFFRLSNFYKTKGSVAEPYAKITKLPDIVGNAKLEAQMVSLYNGIYVFNNTGEICAWNDNSLTWEVGRANSSSLSFKSLQDSSVSGFDDRSNTLLAASDGDRTAYLSYDYSRNAFIKFNGTDLTFSSLGQRPAGEQFKMGVY